ncbi:MAG: hypothetical protein HY399_01035 [Elusimicrobia bacterium]|nr:hypothetical protein [Elusimicrobiota bacterium]
MTIPEQTLESLHHVRQTTNPEAPPAPMWLRILLFFLFATYVAQIATFIILGDVWTDEGWHFNDAAMFSQGNIPYRDFFYNRLPVALFAYGTWFKLLGTSLLKGRILSGLLALAIWVISFSISRRLGGWRAAIITAALLTLNPYATYYYSTISTYSIGSFLLSLAAWSYMFRSKWGRLSHAIPLLLLCLAWGTLYPICHGAAWTLVFLIYTLRQCRTDKKARAYAIFSLALGMLVIGSFFLLSPQRALFDTITFNFRLSQFLREFNVADLNFRVMGWLWLQNFAETIKIYLPIWIILYPALFLWIREAFKTNELFVMPRSSSTEIFFLAILTLLNETFYLVAPQASPDQRTYVFPLASVLAGWVCSKTWNSMPASVGRSLSGIAFILLLAFSPLIQHPPPMASHPSRSDLTAIRTVGREINALVKSDQTILTFSPAYAAESNRNLIPGLAMELFCFYPTWPESQTSKLGVTNWPQLKEYIRTQTPKAIIIDSRVTGDQWQSRILNPYRDELLRLTQTHYTLAKNLALKPYIYRGGVDIYFRKGSP